MGTTFRAVLPHGDGWNQQEIVILYFCLFEEIGKGKKFTAMVSIDQACVLS